MKIVYADIETDGLEPTVVHVICVRIRGTKNTLRFTNMKDFKAWVDVECPDYWVFHNGLGFDVKWVNRLTDVLVDPKRVIDTAVVSRLVNYKKFITHSLQEIGEFLGVYKGDFKGPWEVYTEEMGVYCEQDVEVLEAVFEYLSKYIFSPEWKKALRVEHDMAWICTQMSDDGFLFNVEEAKKLLSEISGELSSLEAELRKAFPPELKEVKRLKYRVYKESGEPVASIQNAIDTYPHTVVTPDNELVCFDYEEFDPASPKHRIDALWKAGWKPTDKTDGYKKYEKEQRKKWTK